jgi:hypothetical protein
MEPTGNRRVTNLSCDIMKANTFVTKPSNCCVTGNIFNAIWHVINVLIPCTPLPSHTSTSVSNFPLDANAVNTQARFMSQTVIILHRHTSMSDSEVEPHRYEEIRQ